MMMAIVCDGVWVMTNISEDNVASVSEAVEVVQEAIDATNLERTGLYRVHLSKGVIWVYIQVDNFVVPAFLN